MNNINKLLKRYLILSLVFISSNILAADNVKRFIIQNNSENKNKVLLVSYKDAAGHDVVNDEVLAGRFKTVSVMGKRTLAGFGKYNYLVSLKLNLYDLRTGEGLKNPLEFTSKINSKKLEELNFTLRNSLENQANTGLPGIEFKFHADDDPIAYSYSIKPKMIVTSNKINYSQKELETINNAIKDHKIAPQQDDSVGNKLIKFIKERRAKEQAK